MCAEYLVGHGDKCWRIPSHFACAHKRIEQLQEEVILLALVTQERDELRAVIQEINGGDNPDLWGVLVAQRNELQTKLKRYEALPKIVCLCGSTRFMDAFHAVGWQLTLDGHIVLTVGVCKHAEAHGGEALGEEVAARLDELHLRKIDLADWVLVLNIDGYIGESTRCEIEYAIGAGKRVTYLEPEAASAAKGDE